MSKRGAVYLVAVLVWGTSGWARAEGSPDPVVETRVETALASTYVFRGVPQYRSKTDPSSQTTVAVDLAGVGPGTVSLSVWNATAGYDYGNQGDTQLEVDLTAAYALALSERLEASVGYTTYLLPAADPVDAAHELTGEMTWTHPVVTPSLFLAADFIRLNGVYSAAALTRDLALGSSTLRPSARVGFATYEGQRLHPHDTTVGMTWQIPVSDGVYASMGAHYAYRMTPDDLLAEPGLSAGDRSVVWAMMAVGYEGGW